MKKLLCLLLVTIMSISFVACGTEAESKSTEALEKCPEDKNGVHDWNAATCEEPIKCSECGTYKDDNLGNHSWSTADCTHPAQCYHCGEYKDDKLGSHVWEEYDDGIRECYHCGMLYEDYVLISQNKSE